MRKQFKIGSILLNCFLACSMTGPLQAAGVVSVPFVPPGLSPGDTYQIVFVTEGPTDALSPDIAYYNDFVQSQAEEVGATTEAWGVTWSAIVATYADVDPIANASVTSPTYLLTGERVATGGLDFWDGLLENSIHTSQYGAHLNNITTVWTGFEEDGTPQFTLGDPLGISTTGVPLVATSWSSIIVLSQTEARLLYAITEELTVIPEPTTSFVLAGMGALVGFARRRRESPSVPSRA